MSKTQISNHKEVKELATQQGAAPVLRQSSQVTRLQLLTLCAPLHLQHQVIFIRTLMFVEGLPSQKCNEKQLYTENLLDFAFH